MVNVVSLPNKLSDQRRRCTPSPLFPRPCKFTKKHIHFDNEHIKALLDIFFFFLETLRRQNLTIPYDSKIQGSSCLPHLVRLFCNLFFKVIETKLPNCSWDMTSNK